MATLNTQKYSSIVSTMIEFAGKLRERNEKYKEERHKIKVRAIIHFGTYELQRSFGGIGSFSSNNFSRTPIGSAVDESFRYLNSHPLRGLLDKNLGQADFVFGISTEVLNLVKDTCWFSGRGSEFKSYDFQEKNFRGVIYLYIPKHLSPPPQENPALVSYPQGVLEIKGERFIYPGFALQAHNVSCVDFQGFCEKERHNASMRGISYSEALDHAQRIGLRIPTVRELMVAVLMNQENITGCQSVSIKGCKSVSLLSTQNLQRIPIDIDFRERLWASASSAYPRTPYIFGGQSICHALLAPLEYDMAINAPSNIAFRCAKDI